LRSFLLAAALFPTLAFAQLLPSGAYLSPLASPGARFQALNPHLKDFPSLTAGQAVSTAVSPDGKTLLILTSGFNLMFDASGKPVPAASQEYVFVEDISHGRPVQEQVLQVPNTYMGIAFSPEGGQFYVSGGVDDDVHIFAPSLDGWAEQGKPVALGHYKGVDLKNPLLKGGVGLGVQPEAAGLAVSADGRTLAVTNFYNDSLSLISLPSRAVTEIPLRPGEINKALAGQAGGEYPFGVAVKGNDTAYVSSLRDREIDVVTLAGTPHLVARIKLDGNPNRLVLNRAGTLLYVTCDNSDSVAVIDTGLNRVVREIRTIAPPAMLADAPHYRGVGPNNLALSPDERTLYVTNGGTNSVAVISLAKQEVLGLIPTGYFPNAVSVSADGAHLYVVNGKSIPGPNTGNCTTDPAKPIGPCDGQNQYILQLSKAGFLDLPVPSGAALAASTRQVAHNEHFDEMPSAADEAVMVALHQRIKHIIYIVRENRTYDEILGDLGEGDGAPALAEFGAVITPNAHEMAANFVDLDHFEDSGEVSGNGWPWSTSAHESDIGAKNLPVNYADRGLSYDWEGTNRNVDVALPSLAARVAAEPIYAKLPDAANILPGEGNIAAPDGPQGQYQRGYIWDAAIRAGMSVRNYGFLEDLARYDLPPALGGIPATLTDPFAAHVQVGFPANPVLAPRTDVYFRSFDNNFPDFYREAEWSREFSGYVKNGNLPNLTLLRLMHDHTGAFKTAIAGVNTPETQIADNDYAVGAVIAAVAHSPYADSTLIFVVEDDAQNGPDHVDAHRSVAFIVGPYVKHHAVVSTPYSTVNFLRTMEDILGTGHLSINDAFQRPMADVFDLSQKDWAFEAKIPAPLSATSLPLPKQAVWHNAHPALWWYARTAGYDWSVEDKIPAVAYNVVLWDGLHHNVPYPLRPGQSLTDSDGDDGD
jgi:YVTN family beta-propeller protein